MRHVLSALLAGLWTYARSKGAVTPSSRAHGVGTASHNTGATPWQLHWTPWGILEHGSITAGAPWEIHVPTPRFMHKVHTVARRSDICTKGKPQFETEFSRCPCSARGVRRAFPRCAAAIRWSSSGSRTVKQQGVPWVLTACQWRSMSGHRASTALAHRWSEHVRSYGVLTAFLRRSYGVLGDFTALQVFPRCAPQNADRRRVLCACSKYTPLVGVLTNTMGSLASSRCSHGAFTKTLRCSRSAPSCLMDLPRRCFRVLGHRNNTVGTQLWCDRSG